MRLDDGRENQNLDMARPRGPTIVIRAARDPIGIPEQPEVVEIAKKNLCVLGLGVNEFKLTNVYGQTKGVPYGASLKEWECIAQELLKSAMEYEP